MRGHDWQERAAIHEYESGMPLLWAESFATLGCSPVPTGYTAENWTIVINDGAMLWHLWSKRILANGWGPDDIRGLLPLIRGRAIIDVGQGDVTARTNPMLTEKIYRRPVLGGTARWECGRRAA